MFNASCPQEFSTFLLRIKFAVNSSACKFVLKLSRNAPLSTAGRATRGVISAREPRLSHSYLLHSKIMLDIGFNGASLLLGISHWQIAGFEKLQSSQHLATIATLPLPFPYEMTLQAIKWENGKLEVLDQILLPTISKYVVVKGVEDGWKVINKMQVRGAPAIAIVGCLSLAVEIQNEEFTDKKSLRQEVEGKLNYLVSARPTAVNIKIAAEELITLANKLSKDEYISAADMKTKFLKAIDDMLEKDIADNKAIGDYGAQEILKNGAGDGLVRIVTHCNTGSLATAGYGTALGVIRSLHEQKKLEHVYCTETRPYNQGARLTAYELVHDKIPGTLICDDMVAALIKTRNISAVIVGADRVVANGDTANKIGTYQIAVIAKYHGVPFYVAAPRTSIDFTIPSGDRITIEERPDREMTHINDQRIAAAGIQCWNPAFDVTPASLITGIITEVGVYKPSELSKFNIEDTSKKVKSVGDLSENSSAK